MKKRNNSLILIIGFFLLIFSSFSLLLRSYDFYRNFHLNNNLKKLSSGNLTNNTNKLYNPPLDLNDSSYKYLNAQFLNKNIKKLMSENQDTKGWIQINNTNIDYPIVQSDDNDFYLNHSFDKSKNKSGWIYLDFRNNLDNLNKNTIIYGHNRQDNSMFGDLDKFLQADWSLDEENNLIKISSLKYNTIWQIFSVYTISKENYYLTVSFISNDSYYNFLKKIKKRSQIDYNTSVNVDDKILTLSTCKDNFGHRIVIHAKLLKKETR